MEATFPVFVKHYDSETKETTPKKDKNLFLFAFFFSFLSLLEYFPVPLLKEGLGIFLLLH